MSNINIGDVVRATVHSIDTAQTSFTTTKDVVIAKVEGITYDVSSDKYLYILSKDGKTYMSLFYDEQIEYIPTEKTYYILGEELCKAYHNLEKDIKEYPVEEITRKFKSLNGATAVFNQYDKPDLVIKFISGWSEVTKVPEYDYKIIKKILNDPMEA